MNTKKIFLSVLALIIVISIVSAIFIGGNKNAKNKKVDDGKLHLVSSNFASYDFLRAITKDNDNVELTFLVGPGKDTHSYEPTAQDIITIQNADLFVYIGGDSEKWADKILNSLDNTNTKIICIADFVDKIEEQEIDGAEEDDEEDEEDGAFDDHIWTSPSNAIKMINALDDVMAEIDSENASKYKENTDNYITEINNIDKQIKEIVDNKVRNRLVFADKMPMQYFINYYNLEVSAAFSGCSTETEPSTSTIAYLIDKAREENIPVILYIELNPGKVANTIVDELNNGARAMQIQALHNVSLDDFNNGETWVSLMTRNIDVLRAALQ